MRTERGFTVPELLVVIVLLLVLGSLLVLIRPKDFSAQEYAAQQRIDMASLLQAIERYKQDKGSLPPDFPAELTPIASVEDGYNLCAVLVPRYLKDIPIDAVNGIKTYGSTTAKDSQTCDIEGIEYGSGYFVGLSSDDRVRVGATRADGSEYFLVR